MPFLMGICELVKIDKAAGKSSNVLLCFVLFFFDTNLRHQTTLEV